LTARSRTRSLGYHEVDPEYEAKFEAYSRGLSPASIREAVIPGRQCGCSQNFTTSLHRCPDCPVLENGVRP
jgi:hypothetical protein